MHKPLILLVDDDPSVLAALETALSDAFAEICRVEAYDNPMDVLELPRRLSEERRSIALVVVDQSMPGIAGTDLMMALRQRGRELAFDPLAHVSVMMLTGYGSLASALAAKNQAGVDRYHEKPWDPPSLLNSCALLLGRSLKSLGGMSHFIIREVGATELKDYFQTRYRLRMNAGYVVPETPEEMDCDEFDTVSVLTGVYQHTSECDRLIGTLRVTEAGNALRRDQLLAFAQGFPSLMARCGTPTFDLPILSFNVDASNIAAAVEGIRREGGRVAEASRFTIDVDARGDVRGNLAVAQHVVESMMAVFQVHGIEHAILSITPHHLAFYERYGFRNLEGSTVQFQPGLGREAGCLYGKQSSLPGAVQIRVRSLARRLEDRGFTCRCAAFPACLPHEYETGEFSASDILCPIVARGMVGTRD